MRRLAAVLVLGLLGSGLCAQSAELTTGVAGLTLSLVGGDVRATRLRNLRDNVDLALNPTAPLFVMELEPDPSSPTWAPDQRIVLRSRDFALGQPILLRFAAGIFWSSSPPGSFVLLPFLPRVVTPPAGSGQGPFLAGAGILYRLFDGDDTIDGKVIAAAVELPGMPSSYRVWRVDFPVIDVPGLSGTGQDALATGAFGGLLLGDPIQRLNLQWPDSGLLDPDFRDLQPGACDPGGYAVPLLHYSDPPSGRGVWFSTDDMTARLKHLRANAVQAQNALRLSGGTFPEGDPFQAQVWESQVWFQLGAFAGDWRAAAEKYRRQMAARSGWYRGPVGSTTNTVVPTRLKSSAVHAVQGTSACQYGRTAFSNPADLARLLSQLSTLDRWCGPVAHVDWDRFPVHEWSEVGSLGFTVSQPQPIGAFVRSGRATAPAPGHGIADRALTEGLLALWCDQGQCLSCPNPAVPPGVAALMADNRDRILPHSGGALFACPRGRGLSTGIDFPAWLAGTMGSAVRTLGLTGFTWTAPAFYGAPCFLRTHAHAPGYGNALAQGWLDIARAVRAAVPGGGDLTVMMETANAWFGQEVCLQNDWSFAAAGPGYTDCFNPARARALFHGLPIRSIPLFAVVADHVKLGSVYHKDSLSLPHTAIDPKTSVATQYFDQFPAVPASLAAWSQATRTLARRGMVFLGLEGHEDLLAMETPGNDLTQRAQADLVVFVRRLVEFLQGPALPFHNGTLVAPVAVSVSGAGERFRLLTAPFPKLATLLSPFGIQDLDWSVYTPVNCSLQLTGREWLFPVCPEERPTWLPNGTYQAVDGRLGVLIGNPWGVRHGLQAANVAMNPFTFDFAAPGSSPGTVYDYGVVIPAGRYPGFANRSYDVEVVTLGSQGLMRQHLPNQSGTLSLPFERLQPFELRGYFLTPR